MHANVRRLLIKVEGNLRSTYKQRGFGVMWKCLNNNLQYNAQSQLEL